MPLFAESDTPLSTILNGPEQPGCSSMMSLPVSDKLQDGAPMDQLRQ